MSNRKNLLNPNNSDSPLYMENPLGFLAVSVGTMAAATLTGWLVDASPLLSGKESTDAKYALIGIVGFIVGSFVLRLVTKPRKG
ncbi:MAG: hypothetical protein EBQ80_03910 [Proteobacteria bacterium]|nr:hypothetical protein [Pseudomonadota bacterium]